MAQIAGAINAVTTPASGPPWAYNEIPYRSRPGTPKPSNCRKRRQAEADPLFPPNSPSRPVLPCSQL